MPRVGAGKPVRLEPNWRSGTEDYVNALAWSPDGRFLASASVGGPISLFDASTGEEWYTLSGHGFGTSSLSWSPDGEPLASAGQDGKVRLWDPYRGEERLVLYGGSPWG